MSNYITMATRMFLCLCLLVIFFEEHTSVEATPANMFDPQGEAMRQEYFTSLRVDNALDRCIQMIGAQYAQRFRKSVSAANMPALSNFSQMEQLRQCMRQEFAGKVPSIRWNGIDGLA